MSERIKNFLDKGWTIRPRTNTANPTCTEVDDLAGPSGHVFTLDQLKLQDCPLCDPWDEDAICLHSEEDLAEAATATRLAKLIDEGDFSENIV